MFWKRILLFLLIQFSYIKKIISEEAKEEFYYGDTEFTISYLTNKYKVEILYDNSTSCPEYSSGPRDIYRISHKNNVINANNSVITICDVSFACHNDRCIYYKSPYTTYYIKNNTQHSIVFSKEDNKNEKLIIHSCLRKDEYCNANPSDAKCKKNSDCFSNICKDERCVIDSANPMKLCRVRYNEEEDFSIGCALDINEYCRDNQSCDSEYCSSYTRMCFNSNLAYHFSPANQYLFIFMGFIMLIMLTLVLYLYYIRDKLISRTLRRSNNNDQASNHSHRHRFNLHFRRNRNNNNNKYIYYK